MLFLKMWKPSLVPSIDNYAVRIWIKFFNVPSNTGTQRGLVKLLVLWVVFFFFVNSPTVTKRRRSYACSCVEVDASEKPVGSFDLVVNPEVKSDTINVGYLTCP